MDFLEFFQQLFSNYTSQTIALGTVIIGAVSGVLGSFAVLRKQSLLGDAISHAALPGIALVFLIIGVKDPLMFLVGAIISGVIGTLWIVSIQRNTQLKSDTALGIILSVFFGFGIVLLTYIQKLPNANQAGLETYLFGQAATLLRKDVDLMMIIGSVSVLLIFVFWKELKLMTFDIQYAATMGFHTKALDLMLTSLIVIAIVLGLQAVGVVLMSALLIAPAAAARQWTNRLHVMVFLSALFGALSGLLGTAISASADKMATGPVIVLVSVVIVAISFVLAPQRGLLFRYFNTLKSRKTMRMNKTMALMYEVVSDHDDYDHPHSFKILNNFKGFHKSCITQLKEEGLIDVNEKQMWWFTEKGFHSAGKLFTNHQKEHDS